MGQARRVLLLEPSLRASCSKCTSDARGPSAASGGMAGATRREGWAGLCPHLLLACVLGGPARVASRASHSLAPCRGRAAGGTGMRTRRCAAQCNDRRRGGAARSWRLPWCESGRCDAGQAEARAPHQLLVGTTSSSSCNLNSLELRLLKIAYKKHLAACCGAEVMGVAQILCEARCKIDKCEAMKKGIGTVPVGLRLRWCEGAMCAATVRVPHHWLGCASIVAPPTPRGFMKSRAPNVTVRRWCTIHGRRVGGGSNNGTASEGVVDMWSGGVYTRATMVTCAHVRSPAAGMSTESQRTRAAPHLLSTGHERRSARWDRPAAKRAADKEDFCTPTRPAFSSSARLTTF